MTLQASPSPFPLLSLPSFILALLVVSNVFSASALYGPKSDVALLSPSDFKSAINSGGVVLVEFFAPWCGHCKNLAPQWDKAATALKDVVTVAAVDCDAHQSIAQEFGIQGFPTIKVFGPHLKKPEDYQGPREAKDIVSFGLAQVKTLVSARLKGKVKVESGGGGGGSKKQQSKSSGEEKSESIVLTSDNFEELVEESKDLWLVEFYAPWCGHCKQLAPEWKEAAKNLKGKVKLGQVDCTKEESLAARFKIKGFPTILVFGSDKDSPTPYEGARTAGSIESFALNAVEESLVAPEIIELNSQEVLDGCADSPICFVTFLPHILDSKAAGREKYLSTLHQVADKFKRNFYKYVWAEAGAQDKVEKALGVGGYGYPAVIALNLKKKVFAPFKSSFELDHLTDFVRTASRGGRGNEELQSDLIVEPKDPWDGKDAEILEEEEFSLEDLMADDEGTKKEEL